MIGSLPIVQYLFEKGVELRFNLYVEMAIFQLFNISLKKVLILNKEIREMDSSYQILLTGLYQSLVELCSTNSVKEENNKIKF